MKKILSAILVLAAVQVAFADCRGTVYFKIPEDWTKAYVVVKHSSPIEMTLDSKRGYYYADLGKAPQQPYFSEFNIASSSNNNMAGYISATDWAKIDNYGIVIQNEPQFTCPGEGNTIYIIENPTEPGKTVISSEPPDSKRLYFLPPEKKEWFATPPKLSNDGGLTWSPMKPDAEHCGWFTYTWFGEEPSDMTVVEPGDSDGSEEPISPMPMRLLFDAYGVDNIYYIPDESLWLDYESQGWYVGYPDVDGICEYSLGALIYDTDAKLHPSFSCADNRGMGITSEGCQLGVVNEPAGISIDGSTAQQYVNDCIGVHQGIVIDTLGPDKKPHLSNSANARQCFPNAELFDMMFNYTPHVNEMSCFDMPIMRADDGGWEFNSDWYTSPGVEPVIPGGFYPVELTDSLRIVQAYPEQLPVPDARTKRLAEGPVYMASYLRENDPSIGLPRMNLVCNGPGWTGGINCEGLYAEGTDLDEVIKLPESSGTTNIWCWGSYCASDAPRGWPMYKEGTGVYVGTTNTGSASPRWGASTEGPNAVMRNQHYCFESHAKFTYKPGQRFAFRGDDDIWVFIDNKIAVDIGGTHLAAPGFVDLDAFQGKSGKLVPGNTYDFDMFFCDRRTTMSNVSIYSNIYFEQKTKVEFKQKADNTDGSIAMEACIIDFHDKDCVSRLGPNPKMDTICIKDSIPESISVGYYLIRKDGTVILDEAEMAEAKVYKGGIDLTNRSFPKINVDKIELPPGEYELIVLINGQRSKFPITIEGGASVVYRNAYSVKADGESVDKYLFISAVAVGEKIPLYVSYFKDPCAEGDTDCDSPLEIKPDFAVGLSYKLDLPEGLVAYVKLSDGTYNVWDFGSMTIGPSGVDTIYVGTESTKKQETYEIGTRDQRIRAKITFNAKKTEELEDFDINSSSSSKPVSSSSGRKDDSGDDNEEFAPPSFRVKLTGPFTFTIVFNDATPQKKRKFAVMNLMGAIVTQGETNMAETMVNLRHAGSYVVRVGHDSRIIKVKTVEENR